MLLAPAPDGFTEAWTRHALPPTTPQLETPDGLYAALGPPLAGLPVLLMPGMGSATHLAVLIPLDGSFRQRVEAAHRIHLALAGEPLADPEPFTPYRRRQLRLMLRALDGRRAGETYRAIAAGLFGADRVPGGRAWKSHDLKARTVRLVQEGLALMQGGYRDLLQRPLSRS